MNAKDELRAFILREVAEIVSDQQMRFQLIERTSRVPEKLFELSS